MSIELEEPPVLAPEELGTDMPPIFGRCPVCKKPLRPRNALTGEPQAPPVGTGFESRAKCDGCGTIIYYAGNGEWRVFTEWDYPPGERPE